MGDALWSKVKKASRTGAIKPGSISAMLAEAVGEGIISADDAESIRVAEELREDAIQVDDFSFDEYKLPVSRNTVEQ